MDSNILKLILQGEDKFTPVLNKASDKVIELGKNVDVVNAKITSGLARSQSMTAGLTRTLVGLSQGYRVLNDYIAAPIKSFVNTNAEMERSLKLMKGMRSEADDLSKTIGAIGDKNYVIDMAKKAPFEIGAIQDAFVKMKSAGLDPTNGSLNALINSVARFGGDSALLKRAAIAIQQMAGKGVVSMEELRQQLGEAIPDAMMTMAESMNMDLGKFVKLVSTGTVEAKNALDNMFLLMEYRSHGAAEEMMKTWSGSMAKLKTEWKTFQEEVMVKSGLEAILSDSIKSFSEGIKTDEFKQFTQSVATGLGTLASTIAEGVKLVYEFKDALFYLGTGLLAIKGFDLLSKGFTSIIEKGKEATKTVNGFWGSLKQTTLTSQGRETAQRLTNEIANRTKERELAEDQIRYKKEKLAQEEALMAQNNLKVYQYELEKRQKLLQEQQTYYNESITKMQEYQAKMAQAQASGNMSQYGAYKSNFNKEQSKAAMYSQEYARASAEMGQLQAKILECEQALKQLGVTTQQTNTITAEEAALAKEAATAHAANTAAVREEIAAKESDVAVMGQKIEGLKSELQHTNPVIEAKRILKGQVDSLIQSGKNFVLGLGAMGAQMLVVEGIIWGLGKAYAALQNWLDVTTRKTITLIQLQREALRGFATAEGLAKAKVARANAEQDYKDADKQGSGFFETLFGDSVYQDGWNAKKTRESLKNKAKSEMNLADETIAMQRRILAANKAREDIAKVDYEVNKQKDNLTDWFSKKYGKDLKPGTKQWNAYQKGMQGIEAARKGGYQSLLQNGGYVEADGTVTREGYVGAVSEKLNMGSIANASGEMRSISGKGKGGSGSGGKGKKRKGGGGGGFQKDTYSDFIQEISSNVAKLTAENEALMQGVNDYASIEKRAEAIVRGKMGMGRNGKKAWSESQVKKATELQVALLKQQDANKLLKNSTDDLSKSEEELNVVGIELDGNYVNMSSAMQTLTKKYATYNRMLPSLSEEQRNYYEQTKRQVYVNTLLVESLKLQTEYSEKLRDTERSYINNSVVQREQAVKDAVGQVAAEYNNVIDNMIKNGATAEEIAKVRVGWEMKIRQVALETYKKNASAIDKLRDQWADATGQMETLSANWSNTFADNVVDAINGTKVSWRDFLRDMTIDMQKVLIKKAFGGAITSLFEGFGSSVGSWFQFLGDTNPLGTQGMNVPQVDINSGVVYVNGAPVGGSIETPYNIADKAMKDSAAGMITKLPGKETALDDLKNKIPSLNQCFGDLTKKTSETAEATGGLTGIFQSSGRTIATNVETWTKDVGNSVTNFIGWVGQMLGNAATSVGSWFFADGGVMTGKGALPLKAYAGGGIAKDPQLAVFGEGSRPEAFVPLPDGRSIPVTLTGGRGMGGNYTPVSISINVESSGASSQTTSGGSGNDSQNKMWSELAQRIKGMVVEEINTQKRPGGVLY